MGPVYDAQLAPAVRLITAVGLRDTSFHEGSCCGGPSLESTYSAKALAAALTHARTSPDERVLFWLTFDGRWLGAP